MFTVQMSYRRFLISGTVFKEKGRIMAPSDSWIYPVINSKIVLLSYPIQTFHTQIIDNLFAIILMQQLNGQP